MFSLTSTSPYFCLYRSQSLSIVDVYKNKTLIVMNLLSTTHKPYRNMKSKQNAGNIPFSPPPLSLSLSAG